MDENGLVTQAAALSVDETVGLLEAALAAKGIKLFTIIDHSGEAKRAGLEMPATKLLIFGNPRAGTHIMLASPSSALDLPLKILVWADADGKTWLTYNEAAYLQKRHAIPEQLTKPLHAIEALVNGILK